MTEDARFWPKVREGVDGCWRWQASKTHDGYGRFRAGEVMVLAHRWAYVALIAEIPADLELDHLCRVRECVNPWHLDPVTKKINVRRGKNLKEKCSKGHDFTGIRFTRGKEVQICRICQADYTQRYLDKKKQRGI